MSDTLSPAALELALDRAAPGAGQVAVAWLGQAGFLLAGRAGTTFMIDPYLSDHAAGSAGLRRIPRAPAAVDDLTPDVILVTHTHGDHLDPPTIRSYGNRGRSTLVAPPAVARIAAEELGWVGPLIELPAGESVEVGGARVSATWTRHGYEDAPGPQAAVGYLVEMDGLALWHAGDTEYDARLHRFPPGDLDVAFLPINGTGGNMNAYEAALLASQLRVGVTVPMHFGMWAAEDYTYGATEPWATLDPDTFVRSYRALAPDAGAQVPVLGEVMVFTARSVSAPGGSV